MPHGRTEYLVKLREGLADDRLLRKLRGGVGGGACHESRHEMQVPVLLSCRRIFGDPELHSRSMSANGLPQAVTSYTRPQLRDCGCLLKKQLTSGMKQSAKHKQSV